MKVLIADDDPVCRLNLEHLLAGWGYEVSQAGDGREAWEVLRAEDPPPLAILDWQMPGMDGLELCRRLRALRTQPYVYVIMLTSRTESPDVVAGIEAGADDFLVKPCHPGELQARLHAGRRILVMQQELRYKASHDPLTGLWNRGVIIELLRRELSRGVRDAAPVGLLMFDLDRFKSINDTHGHLAGDEVLRVAARRVEAAMRLHDALGRYGGEEFLIVLHDCDAAGALEVGERVRRCIGGEPIHWDGHPLPVTASIGVAISRAASDPAALLRRADEALYLAKGRGRDCVVLATPEPLGVEAGGGGLSRSPDAEHGKERVAPA